MSLTVSALRKLQQSGAFPAPTKQTDSTAEKSEDLTSAAEKPPKSLVSKDEPVASESTDMSEPNLPIIHGDETDTADILETPEPTIVDNLDTTDSPDISDDIEPPVSTEEDEEPSELFPHPWKEELTLPSSDDDDGKTTLEADNVDSSTSNALPLFPTSLTPQIVHIPSPQDEGDAPETISNGDTSEPSLDIDPTARPSHPLPNDTEDATDSEHDVEDLPTTTPQQQIEQTELFDKNEHPNEFDSVVEPPRKTYPEIVEDPIPSERGQAGETEGSSLEPLITESINSIERILNHETTESAYGLFNNSDLCDNDLPAPNEPIHPSQTVDSHESSECELDEKVEDTSDELPSDELPSDELPSDELPSDGVIRYTPIIETVDLSADQESGMERSDTTEATDQVTGADISESDPHESATASDESMQAHDDYSTEEKMNSEILPLHSEFVATGPDFPPPIHSFLGKVTEPTAYENEIQENLAKPEFEERFTNLSNQLHTRLQYKLPNSLLMVSPLQTGRIADTLAHLSFMLERDGRNIIMIDANLAEQGLTRRFDSIGQPGICDLITGAKQPHEVIRPTSIPGIQFIPCGDDITGISRTANSTTPQAVSEIVQALSEENFHLLCDVGSLDSTLALPFCTVFEAVLCVVSMRDLEITRLREAVKLLREYEIPVLGTVTTDGQI